ncbi:hypothetical protein SSS_00566 [Sarcoptes scabiei]|uniref:ZP domain-containing protein n=1 Tax=Sarcoptes scabiei TaxID=52283 RepID=A0A834VFX1_SARSC|nr:hypothetical protein SSS_00566 [Sarcoptes scabiei]
MMTFQLKSIHIIRRSILIVTIVLLMLQSLEADENLIRVKAREQSPLLRSRKRIFPTSSSLSNHQNHQDSSQTFRFGRDGIQDPQSSFDPIGSFRNDMISMISSETDPEFNDRVSNISLDCRSKSMVLSLNFTEPFRGVVSVGRSSYKTYGQKQECALRGDGSRSYSLQIFHNRCQTRFDKSLGEFHNTLFVRYHPTLETGGDHSKTLLCKFGLTDFNVNR